MRFRTSIAATIAVSLTAAAPAAAHITLAPAEAPSDGYATLQLQVPHGCDGSPTRAVRVRIPRTAPSVTPQVHPGWDVTTKEGPKDSVELHGETVTRGVQEVVWTATDSEPLPDDRLDLFGMSVKLPAGKPGDVIHFPAFQECMKGEGAWIQIPRPGESEDDLEMPAPAVTLTTVEDGHEGAATADGDDESTEAAGDEADGPSTGLVIAALALGGLGLLTGLAALIGGRRRPA